MILPMKIGGTLGSNEEKMVEHWDLAMKHGGTLGFTKKNWWNIGIKPMKIGGTLGFNHVKVGFHHENVEYPLII